MHDVIVFCRFSAVVRQEVAPPPSKPTTSKPPGLSNVSKPPGISSVPKPPGFTSGPPNNHHYHPHGGGQSYSAVVNTPDVRQSVKSDYASTNSSGGTQTDGSSSQEFHQVHSADMDSLNVRGGWTSQEESTLSDENSSMEKGWPECEALDEVREQAVTGSGEGKEDDMVTTQVSCVTCFGNCFIFVLDRKSD